MTASTLLRHLAGQDRLDPLLQLADENPFDPLVKLGQQLLLEMALKFRDQNTNKLVSYQGCDPCRKAAEGSVEKYELRTLRLVTSAIDFPKKCRMLY
jgi:hypothetical protein